MTFNLKDFPETALAPHFTEAQSLQSPSVAADELLGTVPLFVNRMQQAFKPA